MQATTCPYDWRETAYCACFKVASPFWCYVLCLFSKTTRTTLRSITIFSETRVTPEVLEPFLRKTSYHVKAYVTSNGENIPLRGHFNRIFKRYVPEIAQIFFAHACGAYSEEKYRFLSWSARIRVFARPKDWRGNSF